MAGGEGFEPSTPNLGGWCSIREDTTQIWTLTFANQGKLLLIRAELPAHVTNQNNNLDINTLLKAEKLLIHLEGKRKK